MIFELIYNYPNIQRNDRHVLSGVVLVNGEPGQKRIVVFDKFTHETRASTYSSPDTGEWRISNMFEYPVRSIFVVAFDNAGEFNGEIIDFVSQVLDPRVTFRDLVPTDLRAHLWIDPSDATTVTLDTTDIVQIDDKSGYGRNYLVPQGKAGCLWKKWWD